MCSSDLSGSNCSRSAASGKRGIASPAFGKPSPKELEQGPLTSPPLGLSGYLSTVGPANRSPFLGAFVPCLQSVSRNSSQMQASHRAEPLRQSSWPGEFQWTESSFGLWG